MVIIPRFWSKSWECFNFSFVWLITGSFILVIFLLWVRFLQVLPKHNIVERVYFLGHCWTSGQHNPTSTLDGGEKKTLKKFMCVLTQVKWWSEVLDPGNTMEKHSACRATFSDWNNEPVSGIVLSKSSHFVNYLSKLFPLL